MIQKPKDDLKDFHTGLTQFEIWQMLNPIYVEKLRQQTAEEYRQDIKEMLIVLEALTPKKTEGYKKLTEWKQKYLKGVNK